MNIGLTGGIACGKSTVASMLVQRGAILVDADVLARKVVEPGEPGLLAILERFGTSMVLPDGTLDRKKLGALIFQDDQSRKALDSLLHPLIRREMVTRMQRHEQEQPDKLVVVDVPLLYESRMESLFEEIMVVYVPRSVQLIRLMKRDQLTSEQAELRLDAQMSIEDKKRLADIVIYNDGSMQETDLQVADFWRRKGLR